MKHGFDYLIVGAGISGLATAYFLGENGESSVLVLDKEISPASLASGRNSGLIRHYHPLREMREELARGVKLLKEYSTTLSGAAYVQKPSLWRFDSRRAARLEEDPEDWGNHRRVPGAEVPVSSIFSTNAAGEEEAVYVTYREDGVFDPVDLDESLVEHIKAMGMRIHTVSKVVELKESGTGWFVQTGDGEEYNAGILVNAAGVWADEIGSKADLPRMGMQPLTRHLFYTKEKLLSGEYGYCWDMMEGILFRALEDGTILSVCEDTPSEPGEIMEDSEAEEMFQKRINASYPHLEPISISQSWAGQLMRAPENRPVIRWEEGRSDFYWVAGLGEFGMTYSLRAGQRAAQDLIKGPE